MALVRAPITPSAVGGLDYTFYHLWSPNNGSNGPLRNGQRDVYVSAHLTRAGPRVNAGEPISNDVTDTRGMLCIRRERKIDKPQSLFPCHHCHHGRATSSIPSYLEPPSNRNHQGDVCKAVIRSRSAPQLACIKRRHSKIAQPPSLSHRILSDKRTKVLFFYQ